MKIMTEVKEPDLKEVIDILNRCAHRVSNHQLKLRKMRHGDNLRNYTLINKILVFMAMM